MLFSFRSTISTRLHLCELHLQAVGVSYARVKVRDLFGGGFDLEDDHDVGEDDDASGEDEAEEQDGQDKTLAGHRGLRQPPVQGARGPEGLRGVVPPAHQRHGGPEGSKEPHKDQAQEGVVPLQPRA